MARLEDWKITAEFSNEMLEQIRQVVREEMQSAQVSASPIVPTMPIEQLSEVMQIYGHPLYVKLDWRDQDTAKYYLERIIVALKDAFKLAYGVFDANEKELAYGVFDANEKEQPHE